MGKAGINPIHRGKPKWLRRKLPSGPEYEQMRRLLHDNSLNTVCQEAQCPNQFECFSHGTATFMILGDKCTRECTFCAVGHGPEGAPDQAEPARVAKAVKLMGLEYAVITSVTRDDLDDGGAAIFARTVAAIRKYSPETLIELLIPDLQGNWRDLEQIVLAGPDVLNHNVETVPALYQTVRPQAVYRRSIQLFDEAKKRAPGLITKSGIMVGLGESRREIAAVMDDLLEVGCDLLTIGQYLQPSARHLPVERFVPPEEFSELREIALHKGFAGVASGPAVRSSFEAEKLYRQIAGKNAPGTR